MTKPQPIPLERACRVCGHPTLRFSHVIPAREYGYLWWRRQWPRMFVYRCSTCGSRISASREVLDREAQSEEAS